MDANSGEPWYEADISDLKNELDHGRTIGEAGRAELKGHLYSCAYAATCAPARAIGFPPRHASHRK